MNTIPTVTKNLLIINVLMYLGIMVAERYGIDLNNYLGLHFVLSDRFNLAQLITYMFMHGGFTHLFFNMFAVWMFGRILEQVWGPQRFLFYYLMCGIGAGLIQEAVMGIQYLAASSSLDAEAVQYVVAEGAKALDRNVNFMDPGMAHLNLALNSFTVGASGAVYAILLGFGMLFPNQPLFIFPLPVPIKAKYFVIGYAVIELCSGIANNPADNTAHFAHLGGMLFGFFLIIYWRNKNRNNGYFYD